MTESTITHWADGMPVREGDRVSIVWSGGNGPHVYDVVFWQGEPWASASGVMVGAIDGLLVASVRRVSAFINRESSSMAIGFTDIIDELVYPNDSHEHVPMGRGDAARLVAYRKLAFDNWSTRHWLECLYDFCLDAVSKARVADWVIEGMLCLAKRGKWAEMDDVLSSADTSRLSTLGMVALRMETYRYQAHLPSRSAYSERMRARLSETETPARVAGLMEEAPWPP